MIGRRWLWGSCRWKRAGGQGLSPGGHLGYCLGGEGMIIKDNLLESVGEVAAKPFQK